MCICNQSEVNLRETMSDTSEGPAPARIPKKAPVAKVETPIWRVLIFPGGTEIGLELRHSLAWRREIELFSAGAHISNHAPLVFARHFAVPTVGEPGWLATLQDLAQSNCITHIFPAHDDALLALAQNKSCFKAKLVTSPLQTCSITRSKSATINRLGRAIPAPRLYSDESEIREFPVFLKPDKGQGAQRTSLARDREELRAMLREDPGRIIMEYLPGREFTVDCFSDRERGLLYVRGRERHLIRHGIAMDCSFVEDERFQDYAHRISRELDFHGAWFFQVKEDAAKGLKIMEVAPRIGGTACLSRVTGVNLPLLSLYESERIAVRIQPAEYRVRLDRALVNRYVHTLSYKTIYVDFDDTLVVRGRLNCNLVRLLYQAVNLRRRVVLITRHAGDLRARLRELRLTELFDGIIHLNAEESKADHLKERDAVLIDDCHRERTEVFERTGVPGLDPTMIELLYDDRC